jgi:hypothetical protein
MSAPYSLNNEWDKPDMWENEQPLVVSYPCLKSIGRPSKDKTRLYELNSILTKYPNVRTKYGEKSVVNMIDTLNFNKRINKSTFFNANEEFIVRQEKLEKENVSKVDETNPDHFVSTSNEDEVNDMVDNPESNMLHGRVMTDGGIRHINYDVKAPDFVKLAQQSNASYMARRDRYHIKPRQEDIVPKQDSLKDLLKEMRDLHGLQKQTLNNMSAQARTKIHAQNLKPQKKAGEAPKKV